MRIQHLQRRARNRSSIKQELRKCEHGRSFDTAIMPPSPSISSTSTASQQSTENPSNTSLKLPSSEVHDIAHLSSLSGTFFTPAHQESRRQNDIRYPLGSPTRTFRAISPVSSGDEGDDYHAAKKGVEDATQRYDTSIYEDMNRLLGSLVIQRHRRRR